MIISKWRIWRIIKNQTQVWRRAVLPGSLIVGLIVLLRVLGVLQVQEWIVFDQLMRLRPVVEPIPRVVIVGIDEADLKLMGSYPIPDAVLATMLQILNQYQPRVIGLDLFTDVPVGSGREQLIEALQTIPNLIGVEVALNQNQDLNIQPPAEVPPERIGFADLIVDDDGKIRRSLLASRDFKQQLKYSFPLRITQAYLNTEGIDLQHGSIKFNANQPWSKTEFKTLKSTAPLQFGSTKLPRFLPNTGGYVNADANGNQILLNFYTSPKPFQTLLLRDILQKTFDPSLIQDRVVLVGITAARNKDIFLTAAVKGTWVSSELENQALDHQIIYGVEIHAHAVGQILRAVLDGRPLLQTWSDTREYFWIMVWGFVGITLGIIVQSPLLSLLSIGVAGGVLLLLCYLALLLGWWLPLFPTVLALSAAGLTTTFFDRSLRAELEQRRQTIERTYDAVHNGPLQRLAVLLRTTEYDQNETDSMRRDLLALNQELRSIYESMYQEIANPHKRFYLQGEVMLDLQAPISELLYEVYDQTLERDFPGFKTILSYIPPDFSVLEDYHFSPEQKRGLCIFLQEALCNVGKHAVSPTRLDVVCQQRANQYYLQIIDNGQDTTASVAIQTNKGQGTKQADDLARKLKGQFSRQPNLPRGTICQLTWPAQPSNLLALVRSIFDDFGRKNR